MLLRHKIHWGVLLLGAALPVAGCHGSARQITTPPRSGQTYVYLLMGVGDRAWSGGLDQLATELHDGGCYARVEPFRAWRSVVKEIVRERPAMLVLIGHSHGGDMAVKVACAVQEYGISVRLLVLMDASLPRPIPANVDVAFHYYLVPTTFMFHRGPRDSLEPGNTHTQLTNVAVGREGEVPTARDVDHLTISDSAAIHRMIAGKMAATAIDTGKVQGLTMYRD